MKTLSIFFGCMLFFVCITQAQNFSANTGDTEFDGILKDINSRANADMKFFKNELSTAFGIAVTKIDQLMTTYKMQPADIYMALQVGQQVNKEPEIVCKSFDANRTKGWGVIAKEMGIKPGSEEFHALKGKAKGKNDKDKAKEKGNPGNKGGNSNGKGKSKGPKK